MLIQHDSTLFHQFRKALKIHSLGGATILEGEPSPHSQQLFLLVKDEIFHHFQKIFRTNADYSMRATAKTPATGNMPGTDTGFQKILQTGGKPWIAMGPSKIW